MGGPTLRSPYLRDPLISQEEMDRINASEMTTLRRGYEAGRIGTDINTRLAQESSLRAAGDLAAADALREGTRARQLRQGIYSPAVTQVEQIGGPGDALSWALGQVGQGAASMQDPMLAAAGLTAAGTGLSFVPNPVAKGIGWGLRNLAAPGVAYDIGRKQLKGEAYGTFSEDPEVMARHSAQELDDRASTYGNIAGLLDTALPGLAGRALGGGALRGAVRPRLSTGVKLAGGLVGEGATEAAQELGKQYAHGELNPNRDASGDRSDLINSFLGGAVGAGGPVLAGAGASALYRAGRKAPGAVTDAAGTLLDLGNGAAEAVAVGQKVGRGKDVDLGETLRAASSEKTDTSLADLNLLRGLPDDPAIGDDPEAFRAWVKEMAPRRDARLRQGLTDLAGKGDARAAELLAGMDSPDRATAVDAADAAGDHLIEAMDLQEMAARADADMEGPRRGPTARVASFLGRGARWVAGQAAEGAKAGWEGLTRKQNKQGAGAGAGVAAEGAQAPGRAQLMGEYLTAQADAQAPKYKALYEALGVHPENVRRRLGDIGGELAHLTESWGLAGKRALDPDSRGDSFDSLKHNLAGVARELRTSLGKDGAAQALGGLRQRADPGAAPLFDFLGEQLKSPGTSQAATSAAAKALVNVVSSAAGVGPSLMLKLQRQGIDLTSAGAGRELVRTVQKAGRGDERALAQLDKVFGASIANRMLDTLGMTPAEQHTESAFAEHTGPSGLRLESDSVVEDTPSDFEQRQGQKLYDKTASTRLYGFHGTPRARTDLGGRDPLLGEKDSELGMRRPRLMPLDNAEAVETSTKRLQKQLGDDPAWSFTPKSALQVMADHEGASLQTLLGGWELRNELLSEPKDSEATQAEAARAEKTREKNGRDAASENLGTNPAFINKLMARFRDYMKQDKLSLQRAIDDPKNAHRLDELEAKLKKTSRALKVADDTLHDRLEMAKHRDRLAAGHTWSSNFGTKTTAGQRYMAVQEAINYLGKHGMVVAERGTDRDPQQISAEQVLAMIARAEKVASAAERNGEQMNDLLHFQSRLANSKKDEPGPVKILAGDVAKFAREARKTLAGGEDRSSSVNVNEQYLRDLSDGIAALVASGHVEGLPRGFSGNKMPENLPLRTMTYGAWQWAKNKRAEERRAGASKQEVEGGGDARASKRNQNAVAGEQAREHFTPDDTALPQRTDADEFEGQQRETRAAGMDARELPKEVQARTFPRMSMASRGPRLGAQLHAEMLASFDDGLSQARTYLNQAAAKMPQYLAPVAHALSGERFEQLGTTPAEKAAVKALRAETARLLAASNLSANQKVDLARTLAKPEGRAKVTAQNVAKFLERAGQTSAEKVEAPAPKPAMTKTQLDAASSEALNDWSGPARKLNAQLSRDELIEQFEMSAFAEASDRISDLSYAGRMNAAARLEKQFHEAFGLSRDPDTGELQETGKFDVVRAVQLAKDHDLARANAIAAQLGSVADWDGPARKLNAQVAQSMGDMRGLMSTLGFKTAPPQFADVAAKLLTDPRKSPEKFAAESAEALSHLLMRGSSGDAIRQALKADVWQAERMRVVGKLVDQGMSGKDARDESFRVLVQRALAGQLAPRPASKGLLSTLLSAVRSLIGTVLGATRTPEFEAVVRRELNKLVETAKNPADLRKNFKRVTFQEAVDSDPSAADILAYLGKNDAFVLTGSIVLAHNGSVYRNAENMLHDLDFRVSGDLAAAESYLRAKYDGALKASEFSTSIGKTDTFIVPPPGAQIENLRRQFGDKGGVVGYDVVKGGEVIGRKWADTSGEHREGAAGTIVDFFTGVDDDATSTIPFTVSGQAHSIRATSAAGVLRAKLSMGREKDLNDFLLYVPAAGRKLNDWSGPARKLNAQAIGLHSELKRPGFGAAHNSPIRHEGKFDWRKHLGKGEGAWVYGAGTYLSTADSVHKYYKAQFTAEVAPELEYQAVDRISYRLHRAIGARTEVGGDAAKIAVRKGKDEAVAFARRTLDEHLKEGPEGTISQAKFDTWTSRYEKLLGALTAMPESELRRRSPDGYRAHKSPTYHVSVDIPPDRILDWNSKLSKQPKSVQLRAMKAIKDNHLDPEAASYVGVPTNMEITGEDLYKGLTESFGGDMAKVSDYLQSLGILGHKYVGGSRGEGRNYVIYDDSKIHTNFVAFNAQDPGRAATPEEMQQARDYVKKVLGPKVKVDFEKLTGYSGEWLEAEDVIQISTTPGPGTMQVVYHEALHAFFSKFIKNDPKALDAFKALVDDPKLLERLRGLLADHPGALEQLKHREEVLAYAYQFWAADMLDLPTKPRTMFGKIQRFFRRLLGMISDQERAAAILEAFHAGKMSEPSAAGQVIAKALGEGTLTPRAMRKADAFVSKVRELTYPAQSVLATSMSPTAQKLAPMFWTNPGAEAHGADTGEGYINAKDASATKYKNLLSEYIKGLSDRDLRDVATLLQAGTDPAAIPYAPHAEAVKNIRLLLDRFHDYMTKERGLEIGKLKGYFPRAWSVGTMLEKQGEFIDMLMTKYDHVLADGARSSGLTKAQVAQRIFDKIVSNSVGEHALPDRDDGVLAPFFANAMNRELSWLKQEDSAPFESKDLIGTLTGYFHSGARAAEYAHRFGNNGQILGKMLEQVDSEFEDAAAQLVKKGELKQPEAKKWAARRSAEVRKAVGAMEGTLGKDINSTWRNASAWMTTYQNVRLLPLTLFSSVVDPLGMVARGATMKEAYNTFLRGMREVGTSWADMIKSQPKERQADEWERLAMAVGSVDAAMFSHHVADEYSSMYMNKKAKRLNDAFFRLNGMEAWNRGVRVGATQAAVAFITKHAQLPDKTHSARWLKELGLTQADLTFDAEGKLITHKNELAAKKGIPVDQAEREMEKVHYAIRRWVQGAVLTPNAAQRPSWSSDPHWSFMFHLKQFSYSFHQTLLKRAVNELNYGNLAPIGSFAWYIPVMMASDIMRGLVQGGGELPAHMKGMDLGDHVMRAVGRSGLLSVGSIGVDASNDLFSLAGPAVEQVIDAFGQPLGKTVVDALPAHGLYAQAIP